MKRIILAYLLIVVCYPVLALALNKANNPSFNGNATGWTAVNGSGTNTCGNNNSGSDSNFSNFSYLGSLSGQSAFRASGGSLLIITANYRGMIHQPLTIPGTGSVNVQGSFSYYADETPLLGLLGSNASWIRLDVYNSANNTFVANLGCVTLTDNVPWATTSPVSATLPAGVTYTIRATFRTTVTGGLGTRTVTLGIDNISINLAPVSLSVAQPSTNVVLNWTASTPGSGAPGLHDTEPYEIARKTSAGASVGDIIAASGTNTYTDTSAVGNTTYWYAIIDKDTTGARSPVSTEVSILTKPGVPEDATIDPLDEAGMEISWDPPPGGAQSYTIERAPDVGGSPGTYANLVSGTTATSYSDTGHACGDTYWYRIIAANAAGTSAPTTGIKGATLACISIVLTSDGTVDFGFMPLGSTRDSTASDLNDPEVVAATGGPVDLAVKANNFTHGAYSWSYGSAAASNQAAFEFSANASNWIPFLIPNHYYTFKEQVEPGHPASLFLRLTAPTASDSLGPYSADVTIQASRP